MKKIAALLVVSLAVISFDGALAAQYKDQLDHPSCTYCGMDREKFSHSRMLIEYVGAGSVGTCSIHCMALEFASAIDRIPRKLLVADYDSHDLIEANRAVWVIGGDRPGVMTARPKWAFADRGAAEAFIIAHGGEIASFEQAMSAAYEDMYQDVLRIRKMKTMKMKTPHKE